MSLICALPGFTPFAQDERPVADQFDIGPRCASSAKRFSPPRGIGSAFRASRCVPQDPGLQSARRAEEWADCQAATGLRIGVVFHPSTAFLLPVLKFRQTRHAHRPLDFRRLGRPFNF